MNKDLLEFFDIQNKIFGICPKSGKFFRLSECKIFLKMRPQADWMDKINRETARLDKMTERIAKQEMAMREVARAKGRKAADRQIKKLDKVFTSRQINPDDAHVIFHPVDYVVFNGLKSKPEKMKNILLLDREIKDAKARQIQKSIEKAISKGRYEWVTLRVSGKGEIIEEK